MTDSIDITSWSDIDWLLALTPKGAAAISIPCSMFVLYEISCDMRTNKAINSIQRTIICMTLIDVCTGVSWFLSTWASPRGYGPMSAGNVTTCNIQGFLLQFGLGAPLYNSALAVYFLLIVRYRWTDRKLIILEHWVHVFILGFSFVSATVLIPLEFYNYSGAVCWIIGDPIDCDGSSYFTTGVPCNRGRKAWIVSIALFYAPMWICIVLCVISMCSIVHDVWKTNRRMDRYIFTNFHSRRYSHNREKTMKVGTQAILYTLAFLVTWIPSTLWSIARVFNRSHIILDFLSVLCEPLQGFWFFLIFARQRASTRRKIWSIFSFCFVCSSKSVKANGDDSNSSGTRRNSNRRQLRFTRNSLNIGEYLSRFPLLPSLKSSSPFSSNVKRRTDKRIPRSIWRL
jgi:hypothetical protein